MSPANLRLSIAQLLLLLVVPASASVPLQPKVGEVKGYVKLSSWGNSSLYQLLTDSDYETEPLLAHLVGSRYGESFAHRSWTHELVHMRCKTNMYVIHTQQSFGQFQ